MPVFSPLPRVFIVDINKQPVTLEDPDPSWDPEMVLNYYLQHHPILATATIHKPVIKEDKIVIQFAPTIGDKG